MSERTGELSLDEFLRQLEELPWFGRLGADVAAAEVKRMYAWEEWPGDMEPRVSDLHFRQQDLHDEIMAANAGRHDALRALWKRIHETVFRVAAPRVPYDPDQGSDHAPSLAVWQAAWTAGLVGFCLFTGRPVPPDLSEQWAWYAAGHWPAAYSWVDQDRHGPLVVY